MPGAAIALLVWIGIAVVVIACVAVLLVQRRRRIPDDRAEFLRTQADVERQVAEGSAAAAAASTRIVGGTGGI